MRDIAHWSLRQRQSVMIGGALTVLAVLLGIVGAWFIHGVTERTADRMLGASVRSITETLGVEKGAITLDIPPGAFGMLEDNARDNVYYSVRQGDRALTGYTDFPAYNWKRADPDAIAFRYERYLKQPVRVAAQLRFLPRLSEPIVVQVAETLGERSSQARRMLVGLVLAEAVLVGFAVLLILPAIKWGLKPVLNVQREIGKRSVTAIDLAPLSLADVPPELMGLVSEFNLLLQHLEQSMRRMQRFTADASHQMRTPLAVLRTHIDLLKQGSRSHQPHDETLIEIEDAAQRLQRLLTQLLTLARVEEGSMAKLPPIHVGDVAREVCLNLAPAAVKANLDIRYECEQDFEIAFDRLLLEELLFNLIDNAIRYNRTGSYVAVHVGKWGGKAVLEVRDDGPGIPVADRARATERFFRLDRDQDKSGSGLGLPIAKAICEAIGAQFELCSPEDGSDGLWVRIAFIPLCAS